MKPSYRCAPVRRSNREKLLCLGLLVLAFASFFAANHLGHFRAVGHLFAVCFLFFFIQITSRYLLTSYFYTLEEGTLYLSQRQGERVKDLGGIPIKKEQTLLLTEKEWKAKKKDYPVKIYLSYCQNLAPTAPYRLLAQDSERWIVLSFEPDETLIALLKEELEGENP
ncbi:MAG: hypothetical protein IKC69_05590 [Clostridia bacterium]|nr:hypothetical protein [Clostridia bacterium]